MNARKSIERFYSRHLIGCVLLIAGLSLIGAVRASAQTQDSAPVDTPAPSPHGAEIAAKDCANCHTCEKPTTDEPCLLPCSRPSTVAIGQAFKSKTGPDVVILGEIADRYLPVPFDHKGHAAMADMTHGCDVCHHYTPEGLAHPACKTCHELNPKRVDMRKPSLKGAYHRQCMSCHREWSGNTECGACHVETADANGNKSAVPSKDDLIGRMHPPIQEPELRIYKTKLEGRPSAEVLFRHKEHIDRYGISCAECHREDGCQRCHSDQKQPERVRTLADHHNPCARCHMDVDPAKEGASCDVCHYDRRTGPPRPFEHRVSDLPLIKYHAGNSCRDCHTSLPFQKLDRECGTCHKGWSQETFDHAAVTGQTLDDNHKENDCADCHVDQKYTVPPACGECHDEDDEPVIRFPDRRPGPWRRAPS